MTLRLIEHKITAGYMDIETKLIEAKNLSNWISQNVDGLAVIPGHKNKFAAVCFSLVLDHHIAAILLIEHGRYSSAAALMRLHFDTYIRGCWLAYIANGEAVTRFEKGKLPTFVKMIEALETHEAFNSGALRNMKERNWSILSDFAHSGIQQITRNLNKDFIDQSYSVHEVQEILRQTGSFALLSAAQIGVLSNNHDLVQDVNDRCNLF